MTSQPKRLLKLGLISFAILASSYFSIAAVIYVNPSAAGSNNGTSWGNAYTSLSTALLAAASGDEIWVKQGLYKPVTRVDFNASGGTDAREATFQIPGGVALYGGFNGSEVNRAERNYTSNLTILSGDIDNNDVNADANFIAESTGDIVGNNAYHVVYTANVNTNTRLDGFIITAGKAMSADVITDPNQDGGAWYNRLTTPLNSSSPTIVNDIFQGNYAASEGGAIFMTNGPAGAAMNSLIQNCTFIANKSNVAGGAINIGSFSAGNYQPHILGCKFLMNEAFRRGGAIYLVGDHAIIDSSLFNNNKVTAISMGGTLPGSGGGVGMTASNAVFNRCIFSGNNTTGNPTGPYEGGGGGAVYMSSNESQTNTLGVSEPKFISCGFYSNIANGNTAAWGGAAVHLCDGGKLRPKYINCVFSGNQAQNDGGAIASFARVITVAGGFVPELTPLYTNCSFDGNHAGARGGAIYHLGYVYLGAQVLQSKIENSVLWNNTAVQEGPEVFSTGVNAVSFSLIQGSGGSGGGWTASVGTDGGGNIDTNPLFINESSPLGPDNIPATGDDGLRLPGNSPAVNKGNNAATGLAGITTDYISAARIQGSKVDMGAYEQAGIVIPPVKIYWLRDWDVFKPICLSCPWAFLLSENFFEQFIWDGPAQLIEKGNDAIVTGHIVNRTNKNMGFMVYLKLTNMQDWDTWSAKGRSYVAFTLEAIIKAQSAHKAWMFWELSTESYLEGTGEISGKVNLTNLPSNNKIGFQLGEGANGWDKDFGLSGSFSYEGSLSVKGKKLRSKGIGSMNVDATLCTAACDAISEASVAGVEKAQLNLFEDDAVTGGFSIFPVPARKKLTITLNKTPAEKYTLKFYNTIGQLKKQQTLNSDQIVFEIPVSDLAPGMYILQLISSSGKTQSKKLIIE